MPSETDICNGAIEDWLGQQGIQSISQTTGAAPKARRAYYRVRDSELQKQRWIFSKCQVNLVSITNTFQRYSYAYLFPSDSLKIHWIGAPTSNFPDIAYSPISMTALRFWASNTMTSHEIIDITDANGIPTGQRALLCNVPNAFLVYTKKIEDTGLFPPTFVDVLELEIAIRLSSRLISDAMTLKKVQDKLSQAKADAVMADANEDTDFNDLESPLEQSRY